MHEAAPLSEPPRLSTGVVGLERVPEHSPAGAPLWLSSPEDCHRSSGRRHSCTSLLHTLGTWPFDQHSTLTEASWGDEGRRRSLVTGTTSKSEFCACFARVLALAHKRLPADMTAAQVRDLARADAESDLTFAGFAVLQCPLKPESEPSLRMLRDANHCLVMITGDAPLTACHAASRVHIVDRPVLILSVK